VVSLSIDNEDKLTDLYSKLKWYGAHVVLFQEPDMDNQSTSLCFYGTPEFMKFTKKLDLIFKKEEELLCTE